MKNKRLIYLLLVIFTIPIGLFIRKNKGIFPYIIGEYAPDTLWALMLFWIFAFIFFHLSSFQIFVLTLVFTFCIEISQFYKGELIQQARQSFIGAMLLGHSFLWTDLVCYTIGALIGFGCEKLSLKIQK
jgi:hypothetical protein